MIKTKLLIIHIIDVQHLNVCQIFFTSYEAKLCFISWQKIAITDKYVPTISKCFKYLKSLSGDACQIFIFYEINTYLMIDPEIHIFLF